MVSHGYLLTSARPPNNQRNRHRANQAEDISSENWNANHDKRICEEKLHGAQCRLKKADPHWTKNRELHGETVGGANWRWLDDLLC